SEQQRRQVALEAGAARYHDHPEGEERGDERGHEGVAVDATGADRVEHDRQRPGHESAAEERLAEHEGDGDAREHRVLHHLGEKGRAAQQHVHADDATEDAEHQDLEQAPAHVAEAKGSEEQPPHRRHRAITVAPPSSSSAAPPYVAFRRSAVRASSTGPKATWWWLSRQASSQARWATERSWVDITTVTPSSRRRRRTPSTESVVVASTPGKGSSSSSSRAP